MASSVIKYHCDICKKRHVTNEAFVWCFECNESLCSDCNEIHQVYSILKDHKPIPIEDYQKLNKSITALKYECEQHGTKFDFYCADHDTPICVKCVTEKHRNCSKIKPLAEITERVKKSFLFTDLQERASDVNLMVKQIIDDLSSTQTKVRKETVKAIVMIETTRKTINQHLDNLQDEIIKQIRIHENAEKEKLSHTCATLQDLFTSAKSTLDSIDQADKHASNLHVFCGIKHWNEEIEKQTAELLSLQKNLQYFEKLDVKINAILLNIGRHIKEFATIKTHFTKPAVKLLRREKHGQQLMVTSEMKPDVKLSDTRNITLPTCWRSPFINILGCCIIDSLSMMFTDNKNQRLIHVDKYGRLYKNIYLSLSPYDVVKVDYNTVAVTSNVANKLVLVDFHRGKVVRTVYEGEMCYGICYTDRKFIVCVPNEMIRVIGMDGKVLSTIHTVSDPAHCCVDNNNLYYASYSTDTVIGCDMAGNVRWKLTCNEGDHPSGITIDNKENILVTCNNGNRVITIDKNGKNLRTLLTEADGIIKPMAIAYNTEHNMLLVANYDNEKCFIFNIT